MNRAVAAVLSCLPLSAPAAVISWVKVTEPMEKTQWSVVDDAEFVDRECRSDDALPRVCLYRHISRCRIITTQPPTKMDPRVVEQLQRMCAGYFPEPVLLRRKFSDPNYLPNQAAPAADPAWKFQNAEVKP